MILRKNVKLKIILRKNMKLKIIFIKIKNNFETRFCRFACFTRKLVWGLYVCFGTFLRNMITLWWITWTTVLDYSIVAIGLSQGTNGKLLYCWWKSVNLRKVWLVYFVLWDLMCFIACPWYFIDDIILLLFSGKKKCVLYN